MIVYSTDHIPTFYAGSARLTLVRYAIRSPRYVPSIMALHLRTHAFAESVVYSTEAQHGSLTVLHR